MVKAKTKTCYNFGYGAIYQGKTRQGNVRRYLDYRDWKGRRIQKLAVNATIPEEARLAFLDLISVLDLKKENHLGIGQERK